MPRPRLLIPAAVLALALAGAGCGSSDSGAGEDAPGGTVSGDTLTIYSSLPLRGPQAPVSRAMVNGQRLALADAGGKVGDWTIKFTSLDGAAGPEGWDTAATADNARKAAQDPTTIGYVGDADFGATAISIPVLNQSGVAQVSPAAAYGGFTGRAGAAGKGEPEKYYPSGRRTFARVVPSDVVQAQAQAQLQRRSGCRRAFVVAGRSVEGAALAASTTAALRRAGVTPVGEERAELVRAGVPEDLVTRVRAARPDCVTVAAADRDDPAAALDALHAGLPRAQLFASAASARPAVLGRLGAGTQRALQLTRPVVGRAEENAAALALLARYRRQFGESAPPEALFGYEAMALLIETLRRSGDRANDRSFVSAQLHRMTRPRSVLGPYAIEASGDTSLRRYAAWSVAGGRPVFERVILP